MLAAALLGVLLMAAPAEAYEPGQIVPILNLCEGKENILVLARADMKSTEKAAATFGRLVETGVCLVMPSLLGVKLQRLILDYTDSMGAPGEVWKIETPQGEWFVILMGERLPLKGVPMPPPGSMEA